MKKAYVYVRVACVSQANDFSIVNQKRTCLEYAKAQGYEVKDVFIDKGKSGYNTNRAELQRLFKAIETDPPAAVICTKIDRIFRNYKDFCETRSNFKKQGIKLLSVNEGGDVTTGLIGDILTSIAQYESEVAK